ncbi:MAG TPA: S8 family serine peptidase [Blastocatellia bacterium]|nr:S8 family serine peptidase [Blastocatellia bacterium]
MNRFTAQNVKLSLVGFAGLMLLFWPALLSPCVVSSDSSKPAQIGAVLNEKLILFKRGALDTETREDLDISKEDRQAMAAMSASGAKLTRVIQFAGPIKRRWIDALRATGAEIVGYVPNYAYIIRGAQNELARVAALDAGRDSDEARPIRWMGRLLPVQKLDPEFTDETLAGTGTSVDAEVELIDSADSKAAIETINRLAMSVNHEPRRFLNFVVLSITVSAERLLEIASLDQVLFAGPASEMKLQDERSAQIVAGNLNADGTQPNGPGYMSWLALKGLDAQSDFVIDFTDSGLDRGSTEDSLLHPDFLDSALQSRVAYCINYADDGRKDDRRGHGTIVASVAGGRGASLREDTPGYMYGSGVDPGARLGASRIFDQSGKMSGQLRFTNVASAAYSAGARISNNSWGNSSNGYDAAAQEFDSLVRDARPSAPDNQEMTFVFSAGNFGAGGHVSSPGTAKNVISVAASENYRPEGIDSCNLDGGGNIGPDGADNVQDILRYSSGGPTSDGRAKPDITAPGTHIYGAASQAPGFFGDGLCPGVGLFQPPNQTLYTWSSGTSLAAPHISGAASLTRRFFVARNLLGDSRPPSPAMTKAYLLNSASYLSGENAGGSLPGERQGWGLANLSRAFDGAKRELVDQTRLFTESGQTFEIQGSIADRSAPLRVTLVWTDAPGSLIGPAIVNDLDLEITIGGVTVYRGNRFAGEYSIAGGEPDRLNNVESIYLPSGAIPMGIQGNFTVTVRAANIAGDGVPGNDISLDQDFALVVYNIAPPVQSPPPPPPKVPAITGVTYVKKTIAITGRDFTAAAQVEINGRVIEKPFEFDSSTNSLSLRLKPGKLNLIEGDNQIVLIENGERSQPSVLRF